MTFTSSLSTVGYRNSGSGLSYLQFSYWKDQSASCVGIFHNNNDTQEKENNTRKIILKAISNDQKG